MRLAGSSRCRSRTAVTRCSSCRRRRRVSRRWKGSACSSGPRRASRRRSAACSLRSRTRSRASATARTSSDLLEPAFLDRRRAEAPAAVAEPAGGTVYLCAVDSDRMAVSFIQSNYMGFGSGLAAPGTGVCLQNRGAGFSVSGAVEPGRRPYHTIIPGMLLRDGALAGPFGVMGGFLQAQAHLQLVSAIVDDGLDPAGRARAAAVHGGRRRRQAGGGALGARCRPRQARHRDRARDEHRLLRRRPGDPRRRATPSSAAPTRARTATRAAADAGLRRLDHDRAGEVARARPPRRGGARAVRRAREPPLLPRRRRRADDQRQGRRTARPCRARITTTRPGSLALQLPGRRAWSRATSRRRST